MSDLSQRAAPIFITLGRMLLTLAFLALLGAWLSQLNGGAFLELSQQHLFSDAMALALLGIGCFLDAFWHARNV